MTNILSSSFEVFDIVGVLVVSLPILMAILFSRRYNMLHGLVTFLFFTTLVSYITSFGFFDSIAAKSVYFLETSSSLNNFINGFLPFDNSHIIFAVYTVAFVLIHLISSKARKSRLLNAY